MEQSLDDVLAPFDYVVSPELIAQSPAHPRDSAKLLVFDRKTQQTSFDTFANICDYLPKNCVLVFNRTKVIPARIHLAKPTGGKISALYLSHDDATVRMIAEGKSKAGDMLHWINGQSFTVIERDGKEVVLQPSFPMDQLRSLLEESGETPLPPYIKHSPLNETQKREEYQTVFAKQEGSVAAPTAGLHFTKELITKIEQSGRDIRYVTLHVGLGTFAPVTEEHWQQKKLHEEWYEIDEETAKFLNDAKKNGRTIIAVGTTSVRTLESATTDYQLTKLSGSTNIFITEHDSLKFTDGLITNFHVPRSSLLMLVSAFVGREKLLDLYAQAIDKKFRFFSFGDGMMIL